jgi:acetylglutamate kinase
MILIDGKSFKGLLCCPARALCGHKLLSFALISNQMDTHDIPEREFRHYLELLMNADYPPVIKAGGKCLKNVPVVLRELHGICVYPVFIHGGQEQIDDAMDAEGVDIKKIKGKRVTDERTMEIVGRVLEEVNSELVNRINHGDVCAEGLNRVFYVDGEDPVYGYVGNIIRMDKEGIDSCLQRKRIPVISSLGVGPYGKSYNPNADSAFRFLVESLNPCKAVSLTPAGGVSREGKIISEMNYDDLLEIMDSSHVDGGMSTKLVEIAELVKQGFDVHITSPEHLMFELFSEKGRGTYIKGMGH